MKIKHLDAYQILDSRGNPTIEAEISLDTGITALASVPAGASTGKFEAQELRDHDPQKFLGRSVYRAIDNIQTIIAPELIGKRADDQEGIDQLLIGLDGTENKSRLGANALLAVSMAIARVAAFAKGIPLFKSLTTGEGHLIPIPEIQIMGGGAHSGRRIDIQDFMVICHGAASYAQCIEMTFNIYHCCGELLKEGNKLYGLADEGGYWPALDSHEEGFDLMLKAIEKAGYRPGTDVSLSLDVAAAELFSGGYYHLTLENRTFTPKEFYDLIHSWCQAYPILSLEDPFAETDRENWARLTSAWGDKLNIIGDDLFATSVERVRDGVANRLANSVLIKLNQIGTVTETIECIRQTQQAGWLPVVSGRSGETEDPFIAHLAVATNAGQLKLGALARSERTVKWNEILRIERALKEEAQFAGGRLFDRHGG